jgi:G3E family GTPase
MKQVAVADRIVLAKTDIAVDSDALAALHSRLRGINPSAPIIDTQAAEAGYASLFECGLYNPETKTADVRRWFGEEAEHAHHHHGHSHDSHAHEHRHDERIRTFTLLHDRPVPFSTIEMFLDLLGSAHGDKLLRMKGVIELAEDPSRPLVVHGVQSLLHPPVRLPSWPDDIRGTRLVLITLDMPEDYVRRMFAAFTNTPDIDTPDRTALEHNPLAVPGMR